MGIIYHHQASFLTAAQSLLATGKARAIAPTRQTARLFQGARYSLENLATDWLQQQGWQVLNPLERYQQLKQAIATALQPSDLEGTVKTWQPAIHEILQTTTQWACLQSSAVPRLQQLYAVIQQYDQQLQTSHAVDPAAVLWQAIALGCPPQTLCIYGYPHPRVDEIAFIQAVAASDSLLYLPCLTGQAFFQRQTQILQQFQAMGWHMEDRPTAAVTLGDRLSQRLLGTSVTLQAGELVAYHYPNREAEARGTLRQIKQLLQQGVPARDIAIVSNQEQTWGAHLLDIAWEYHVPLSLPNPVPLTQTRLGAWFSRWWAAIATGYGFEATAQWLSHPLSHPLGAEFWQVARTLKPDQFATWQPLVSDHYGLNLPEITPTSQQSRRAWVQQTLDLLNHFDVRRQAVIWATEAIAYKKFTESITTLGEPATELLTWEMFQGELSNSLELLTTPAYPLRGGVGLHNPQNLVGAQYAYLFVIDGAEGILPRPIQDQPILDFYTRKQLQQQLNLPIEGAIAKAEREQFLFYSLLQVAQTRFTFSCSSVGKSGNRYVPQTPSIYFKKLNIQPQSAPLDVVASYEEAQQFYLTKETIPAPLQSPQFQQAIAAHRIEQNRLQQTAQDRDYQGMIGVAFPWQEHRFSASQLLELGQCAFKWFAKRLLRVTELDDPITELEPSQRGQLYHHVLELALKAYQENSELNLTDPEQLNRWFKQAETQLQTQFSLSRLPAWQQQRTEHLQTIQRAIAAPNFLPADRQVVAVEQQLMSEWQDFQLTSRIDRIDRTDQHQLVIVDYKTSGSPPKGIQDDSGKLKLDLQLPIYQAIVQQQYADYSVHQALYYSLTKAEIIKASIPDEITLKHAGDRLKNYLETGNYPVQPDIKYEACQYCDCHIVCRVNQEEQDTWD